MNEPEEIHRPRTTEEQKAELRECISAGDFRTSEECVLSSGTEPSILRMILREARKINPGKAREFAAELRYHANGLVRELAGKILNTEQAEIEETTGIYLSPDIAASFDKIEKKINGSERQSAGIKGAQEGEKLQVDALIEEYLEKHEDPTLKKHEDSGDKKSQPDELNAWIKEHLKKHGKWDSYSELPAEPGAEVPVPDLNEQILQAVEERKKSAREAFVIAKKICEGKKGLTEVGITKLLTELKSSEAEFSRMRLQILKALPHLALSGGREKCGLLEEAINALIHRGDSEEIMEKAIEA